MARHAVVQHRSARRQWLLVIPALLLVAVLGVVTATVATGADWRGAIARAPVIGDDCPSARLPTTTVELTVVPDVAPTVEEILRPLRSRELPDGRCLEVTTTVQEPGETVAGAQVLPDDRAPHLWIPDSSLWLPRLQRWPVEQLAQFASSPVVLATSPGAVQALGWDTKNPTWQQAMGGARPVAARDIAQDAAGLSAVIALWQSMGRTPQAEQGLAAAVLAALRAGAPTRQQALTAAEAGSPGAPLIPVPEQVVRQANRGRETPRLVAVYPEGGSPSLDYPVVRLDSPRMTASERLAAQAIADALDTAAARAVVRADGLRDSTGATDPDATAGAAEVVPAVVRPLAALGPEEVSGVVRRIVSLSAPSRILVAIDMSTSMRAPAGNGMNRAEFAAVSAREAGNLLPDVAQAGLWGFSRDLRGEEDRIEVVPVGELGAVRNGVSNREAVNRGMFGMPGQLAGNGTTLYATAIAAMQRMTQLYDPRAGNAVVLFTDGANDDDGGPSLDETVAELKRIYDPQKPVRLICIGIGPGADVDALKQLAAVAGGAAYPAMDPAVLPRVLFETMSRRDG